MHGPSASMADDSYNPGETVMFSAALIAVTLAGAPAQMVQCVDVPPGRRAADIDARGEAWFANGEAIRVGGRLYVRAGPVRGMAPNEVEAFGRYREAMIFAAPGDAKRDLVYVLADIRDCTFQPYRATE